MRGPEMLTKKLSKEKIKWKTVRIRIHNHKVWKDIVDNGSNPDPNTQWNNKMENGSNPDP
jgi:hypothetical protein